MSSFCKCKSYSHFFSKNNSLPVYAIFNDQSFKLTNDIVSFEQLAPVFCCFFFFFFFFSSYLLSSSIYLSCVKEIYSTFICQGQNFFCHLKQLKQEWQTFLAWKKKKKNLGKFQNEKKNNFKTFSSSQVLTLVLLNPDMSCLCKQCRSRSVGFREANWSGPALFVIK